MSSFRGLVRAPSNIALIKYMGKRDAVLNLPENPSLSMTLDSLSTWVDIEAARGDGMLLVLPEAPRGAPAGIRVPDLGTGGKAKVVRHVERVRAACDRIFSKHGLRQAAKRDFVLRTGNTFPEASGIASSASSFAAITLAAALASAEDTSAFRGIWSKSSEFRLDWAKISRQGSGSSCRSFEGPFVQWEGEDARAVGTAMPELRHFVVLICEAAKEVSSSEAHLRVKSSSLWPGRAEAVARRLELLLVALGTGDFTSVARLAWAESWEMHSLFHTSEQPFSYWKPGTVDALHWFAPLIQSERPPIVTMDAGPNIHVIVPAVDADSWRARLAERFGSARLLEDRPGTGAVVVS